MDIKRTPLTSGDFTPEEPRDQPTESIVTPIKHTVRICRRDSYFFPERASTSNPAVI